MKTLKKVLALVLAFAMVVGSISTEALASAMAIEDYGNVFTVEYYNGDTLYVSTECSIGTIGDVIENGDFDYTYVVLKLNRDLAVEDFNEPIIIPNEANVVLDLNGHSIETNQRLFTINHCASAEVASTLTIRDSSDDADGTISMVDGADIYTQGGCIFVGNYATFNLEDGATISGYSTTNTYGGGAVAVSSNATFNMTGGTITNCSALAPAGGSTGGGGAVRVSPDGTFNMSGGTISAGSATTDGYGLGIYNLGTVNISNGEIIGFGTTKATSAIYSTGSGATCTLLEEDEQDDDAQPYIEGYMYAENSATLKAGSGYFKYNKVNASTDFEDILATDIIDGDGKTVAYQVNTLSPSVTKNGVTYVKQIDIAEYTCKIVVDGSDVFYYTVDDALAHATDGTTTVLLIGDYTSDITVPSTANGILDLNGYNLSGDVTNNGTYTITDSSASAGTVSGTVAATAIEAGNFTGTVTADTISGGTFTGSVTATNITAGYFDLDAAPTCSNITGGYYTSEVTPATGYTCYSAESNPKGLAEDSIPAGYTYAVHSTYAAMIGSVAYETLQEAIDAVPNNSTQYVITLLRDIDEAVNPGSSNTNKIIVLDLAGHTITNTDPAKKATIYTYCRFTINDSVGGGKIYASTTRDDKNGTALYASGKYAVVTLNAGTIDSSTTNAPSKPAVYVYGGASLNINGGAITNGSNTSLLYVASSSTATINSGSVEALQSYNTGKVIVNGGTVSGNLTSAKSGGITIYGGNIGYTTSLSYSGANNGYILFKGGYYTENNDNTALKCAKKYADGRTYIMKDVSATHEAPYIYKLTSDVCSVGDETYESLADAVAAIVAGTNTGTITLLSNVDEDLVISSANSNITFDLAGFTWDGTLKTAKGVTSPSLTLDLNGGTLSTGSERVIDVACDLTIQDSSVEGTGNITSTATSYIVSIDGSLTLTGGTITATAGNLEAISLSSGATADIRDGRVVGALCGSGAYTISGGQIAGTLETSARYTVSGGYFKNILVSGQDGVTLDANCECVSNSDIIGCNYLIIDGRPIVARIGDAEFHTISDAISAAVSGDTITVDVDNYKADEDEELTIPSGKELTINFGTSIFSGTLTNNGTLSITGSASCTGNVINNGTYNLGGGYYSGTFTNAGTLNVDGGTVVALTNTDTVVVNNGTIKTLTNDTDTDEDAAVSIYGGYFDEIVVTDAENPGVSCEGGFYKTKPTAYLAAEHIVRNTGDSSYPYKVVDKTNVCVVTNCADDTVNISYLTIEEALAAIEASSASPKSATITMIDSYFVENQITVAEDLDITFDLNGQNLEILDRDEADEPVIDNLGTLHIIDDDGTQAGYVYGSIENAGSLVIDGGHYVGEIATTTTTTTINSGYFKYNPTSQKADGTLCLAVTGVSNINYQVKSRYISNSEELSSALADGNAIDGTGYIVSNNIIVNMSDNYDGTVGEGKTCLIDLNHNTITYRYVNDGMIIVPATSSLTITDSVAKADSNADGGSIIGHTSTGVNSNPNVLIKNAGTLDVRYVNLIGGADKRTESSEVPSAVVYSTGTTTIGYKALINAGSTVTTTNAGVYVDGGTTTLKRCFVNEASGTAEGANPVIVVANGSLYGSANADSAGNNVGMKVVGGISKGDDATISISLGYFDIDVPADYITAGSSCISNTEDNNAVYPYKVVGDFEAINLDTGVTYTYAQDAINEAEDGETIQLAKSIYHDGLEFGGTYIDGNSVEHTRATNINFDFASWVVTIIGEYDSELGVYVNDAPAIKINEGATVHIYSSRAAEPELGYFTNMISTSVQLQDGSPYIVTDLDLNSYRICCELSRTKSIYHGCGAGIYNAGNLTLGGKFINIDGEEGTSAEINITGCFTDGAAGNNGGALYNASTGVAVLDNVNIGNDPANYPSMLGKPSAANDISKVNGAYRGAAIYNAGGIVTVKNSNISNSLSNSVIDGDESAQQNGGTIYVANGGKLTLSGSKVLRYTYQDNTKSIINVYGNGSTLAMEDGYVYGKINFNSGTISKITGGYFASSNGCYEGLEQYTTNPQAITSNTQLSNGYKWHKLDSAESLTYGSTNYEFTHTPEVLCVARIIRNGVATGQYATLQTAIDAVNKQGEQRTIELLCDVTGETAKSGEGNTNKYTYLIYSGNNIILDLCGFTITETPTDVAGVDTYYSVFRNLGTLTIQDSVGGGAITMGHYVDGELVHTVDATAAYPQNGGGIYNNGTLTLNSGTIKNCYTKGTAGATTVNQGQDLDEDDVIETSEDVASGGGAGVYINAGKRFTMNGGTIEECQATNNKGGGVYCSSRSVFVMNDGTITKCKAYGNGGAVHTYQAMTAGTTSETQTNKTYVYMYGGTMSYNYAGHMYTMTDGSKTTTGNGGAVNISSDCIFYMYGGTLYRNRAYQYGGGVNIGYNADNFHYGTFKMYGIDGETPTITQNQCMSNGGGVYYSGIAQMGVWGSILIQDNHYMSASYAYSKFLSTAEEDYVFNADNNLFLADKTVAMDGPLTTGLETGTYQCCDSADGQTYVEGSDNTWYYTTAEGYSENYVDMAGWTRANTMITLPNYTETPIYKKTFSEEYKYVDSNGDIQTGRTPGTYFDDFSRYTTEDEIGGEDQVPVVDTDYYRFDVIAGREDWDYREVPQSGTEPTELVEASDDYNNIIYVFMAEIDSASVTLANELAINYYCSITKAKYEKEKTGDVMLLYVTLNGEKELIQGELITDASGNPDYLIKEDPLTGEDVEWVQWIFTFNGIDPCWMAEDINSSMYVGVKDSSTGKYKRTSKRLTDENVYSVAEYCNDLYKAIVTAESATPAEDLDGYSASYRAGVKNYYTTMKTLLADILMYGKAAQEFRHYKDGSVEGVAQKLCTQVDWGYIYDGRGVKASRELISSKPEAVPVTTFEDAPAWIYWDTVCWTESGSNTIIDEKSATTDWEWIQKYTTSNDYDQAANQYGGSKLAYDTKDDYFERNEDVPYVSVDASDNICVNYAKNTATSGLKGDASQAEIIGLYTMFGTGGYIVPRICFNAAAADIENGYVRIKVTRVDGGETLTEYYETSVEKKITLDYMSYYYVELASNYDDEGERIEDFLFYPQEFGDKFTIQLQIQTTAGKWRGIHACDYSINSYCCQWIDTATTISEGNVFDKDQSVLMGNLAYATYRYGRSIGRLVDAINTYSGL